MGGGVILEVRTEWYCPNCPARAFTTEAQPHTRYHPCPKLYGISAPLIRVGVEAKVEAMVREDYVGRDDVPRDDRGVPIMSVVTTRNDGMDCAVFAPTATTIG